jgi:hypothetical protein
MKRKSTPREKLLIEMETAERNGTEFVSYGGRDDIVTIGVAIERLLQLPGEQGNDGYDPSKWYECDASGNRIIRTREIYGGLTRHESGVIVWNGSADPFCGTWVELKGMPRSFGPPNLDGEGRKLVAVCLGRQNLDDDTLELAFAAARAKGDKTPTISEVFRVNEMATIITFESWP